MNLRSLLVLTLVLVPSLAAQTVPTVPFFGNEKCPVSGKPVDQKLSVSHEGERIFLCCAACFPKVEADRAGFHAKAYPKAANKKVGNTVCPVAGKKIEGGETVVFQGHELKVCCPKCVEPFKKTPNRHLAKMLAKTPLKELGNERCVVMPRRAVKDDVFVLHEGKIVDLCCAMCVKRFIKDPTKYLPKSDGGEPKPAGGQQRQSQN